MNYMNKMLTKFYKVADKVFISSGNINYYKSRYLGTWAYKRFWQFHENQHYALFGF